MTLASVTLDEWSSPWLRKPLLDLGYQSMVEVVGYEKDRFNRPAAGNRAVTVRRAEPSDLQAVLALDAACFPLPWVKGAEIFEPAIVSSPCFLIAAFGVEPVGYAFVTSHQAGQLFHLVRIAVAPAYQGLGIGIRLLAEIVDFCASRHAELLTLNTQADNYTAQRLYEWFGFVRTGEQQTVLGLDFPVQ
jgi:ribosomal protein S18 acetylase RimI-like enzyme